MITIKGAGFTSDAQLFFNDVAATVIPGSEAITAMVLYVVNGRASALAHVESAGQSSNTVLVPLAPAAPGIFTVNGTGTVQASAFNQDGTPNSQASPRSRWFSWSPSMRLAQARPHLWAWTKCCIELRPPFPFKVQVTVPPLGIQASGTSAVELIENGLASQPGVTIWISQ